MEFFFGLLMFALAVVLARWIFRINDILVVLVSIVDRLDMLIDGPRKEENPKEVSPAPLEITVEKPIKPSIAYRFGKKIRRIFSSGVPYPRPLCPQCNVPVTVSNPVCPKCGQRVRLSRPASGRQGREQ